MTFTRPLFMKAQDKWLVESVI